MNNNDYRYFRTAATVLNLNRAAEILYISPQALSKRIMNLEEHYKVALFERKPKLKLTYAGERLLVFYDELAKVEALANAEMQEIGNGKQGEIRIGMSLTRSNRVFPPVFSEFHRAYPNVRIQIKGGSTETMIQDLVEMKTDLMIAVSTIDSSKYTHIDLAEERFNLFVSDTILKEFCGDNYFQLLDAEKSSTPVSIKEFRNCPFLVHLPGSRIRTEIDMAFSLHNITPRIIFSVNNVNLLLKLAKQGLGVTAFPLSVYNAYETNVIPAHPRMHQFSVSELSHYECLKITYLATNYLPRYIRTLIDIIVQNANVPSTTIPMLSSFDQELPIFRKP